MVSYGAHSSSPSRQGALAYANSKTPQPRQHSAGRARSGLISPHLAGLRYKLVCVQIPPPFKLALSIHMAFDKNTTEKQKALPCIQSW